MRTLVAVFMVLLAGCVPSMHVTTDFSVASDLPAPLAVGFLQQQPRMMRLHSIEHACMDINEHGASMVALGALSWSAMEVVVAQVLGARAGGAHVVVKPRGGSDFAPKKRCYVFSRDYLDLGRAPTPAELDDAAREVGRTLTALASLGVHVPAKFGGESVAAGTR